MTERVQNLPLNQINEFQIDTKQIHKYLKKNYNKQNTQIKNRCPLFSSLEYITDDNALAPAEQFLTKIYE